MIIYASSFIVFSHALARGGCQHTCNDSVYCVIIIAVADPLLLFPDPFTILAQDYVLTCCCVAGVLKRAPALPAAVLRCHGDWPLVKSS